MKELIVIGGPTASGKTALSIALAKKWNTVIISADSRQFYKEMTIGTAKPTADEMENIPHYFINSHSITDEVNAARFANEASELLSTLFQQHEKIILVGGSGMFIDALCFGLDDIPHDSQQQQQLEKELELYGLAPLLEELQEKDPDFYNQVDKSNPVRIIRALEVIRATNRPFSSFRKGEKKQHDFSIRYFVMNVPREILYDRINRRVDVMVENGLEQEAKNLVAHKHLKPLATVGYSEWFRYLEGEFDRSTCIELIKQNSRRYAKRQVTWFKRNPDAIWIPYGTSAEMTQFVLDSI